MYDSGMVQDLARSILLQVLQQAVSPTDHPQQPAPRRMILLAGLEVIRQMQDSFRQQGDLNFRAACVALVHCKLFDLRRLLCFGYLPHPFYTWEREAALSVLTFPGFRRTGVFNGRRYRTRTCDLVGVIHAL